MLRTAFENVIPYLTHINVLREFVEEHSSDNEHEIIAALEKKVADSDGTLKTDFRILLNEMSKMINTEL